MKMNDTLDLMQFFGQPVTEGEGPAEYAIGVDKVARDAVTLVRTRIADWKATGDYTTNGFVRRAVELAEQELARVDDSVSYALKKMQPAADELRAKLGAVPATGDDKLEVLWCRDQLLQMTDAERWAEIARAVDDGEAVVVAAVLAAPRFVQRRMMLPEMIEALRERWSSTRDPVTAQKLRALESAIASVRRAGAAARAAIVGTPGLGGEVKTSLRERLQADPIRDALKAVTGRAQDGE
jgi:hypothetical protein